MKRECNMICKAIAAGFPGVIAIIHWGGAFMRGRISTSGDMDILIVTDNKAEIAPSALLALKKKFKKFDLDVYAMRRRDLRARSLVAIGPYGPYHMHELIHYQLKHESEVIYGGKKILRAISPMPLEKALAEIVPYVRDNMMSKLEPALAAQEAKEFAAANLNILLVIVRTMYAVEQKKLATKEDALEYLAQRHPALARLSSYLLKKYAGRSARAPASLKYDMKNMFALARRVFEKI